MNIWSSEIKAIKNLLASFQGQFPDLEKELKPLIGSEDANVVLLYSRRCLEVIINELCEVELNRPHKTEPLKGIIDKLNSENKVPEHIITSMLNLNSLSNYGAHPKDFDAEQVKPVLNNLHVVLKWYLKYRNLQDAAIHKVVNDKPEIQEFSTKSNPKKRKLLLILGISILVITVLAFVLFKLIDKFNKDADIASLEKSIAVLPFKYLSTDKEKQYQADGMMDAILQHLSKIKDLTVKSRTSVEQYRDTKKTLHDIGKELDVSFILEGTFQKEGDKVKLIVQLLTAENEAHVWSNDYNRDWKEVFEVQSEVAQDIAGELKTVISPEVKKSIEKIPTANLTAYDYYQQGKEAYIVFDLNAGKAGELKRIEKLFRTAIKLDSTFAEAYSALGLTLIEKRKNNEKDFYSKNYMDSCLILANMALKYNQYLPEAFYVKGLYYWMSGNSEKVEIQLKKALELNPNYSDVYFFNGNYFYILDKDKQDYIKAIDNLEKGIAIDRGENLPKLLREMGSSIGMMAGLNDQALAFYKQALNLDGDTITNYYYLIDYEITYNFNPDKAVEYCEKVVKSDPENINYISTTAFCYHLSHKNKESLEYYKKLVEWIKANDILSGQVMHRIAYAYLKNGYQKEATYWFDKEKKFCLESIEKNKLTIGKSMAEYYDLAGVYAMEGNKEKSIKYLNMIVNQLKIFPLGWVSLIKHDPLFDSMRDEPEFQQIVKVMESKYNAEHERVRKWLEEQGKL
ncbi:MAG: hypothetical protein U0W24_02230 [Bacteroidales bacterium]